MLYDFKNEIFFFPFSFLWFGYVILFYANIYMFFLMREGWSEFKHARANEAFFFTTDYLRPGEEEGRVRPTPGGYWKAYGDDVPIYRGNRVIGFKTKLFFHDNVNDYFTDWKMNQFKCHPSRIPPATTRTVSMLVHKYPRTTKMSPCILIRIHY